MRSLTACVIPHRCQRGLVWSSLLQAGRRLPAAMSSAVLKTGAQSEYRASHHCRDQVKSHARPSQACRLNTRKGEKKNARSVNRGDRVNTAQLVKSAGGAIDSLCWACGPILYFRQRPAVAVVRAGTAGAPRKGTTCATIIACVIVAPLLVN